MQGEQVGILWPYLLRHRVKIHFAHRTFQWSSEARGKAAVHCVIIGFALHDTADKRIFDYETPQTEAHEIKAQNINPYLVDAADIFVEKRRQPIDRAPPLVFGNMPNDGGNLLLTEAERDELLKKEPASAAYVRRFIGSEEYINKRYCLWLQGVSPAVLKSKPLVMERIQRVKAHRPRPAPAQPRKR